MRCLHDCGIHRSCGLGMNPGVGPALAADRVDHVSLSQFWLRLKGHRNKTAGFFVELVEITLSSTKKKDATMPAQPKSTTGPRVLTVRELAAYLRVHQTTVYRLLREQKLPAFRVGADWRFERAEIERWMTHEQKRS
jgi:excisionase family DNA binding protein